MDMLQDLDEYRALPDDLVESAKRWMEWMTLERPEDEPLPGKRPLFVIHKYQGIPLFCVAGCKLLLHGL